MLIWPTNNVFYHRRTSVGKTYVSLYKHRVLGFISLVNWSFRPDRQTSCGVIIWLSVTIASAVKQQERETQRMLSQIRQQKQQERLEEARNSVSVCWYSNPYVVSVSGSVTPWCLLGTTDVSMPVAACCSLHACSNISTSLNEILFFAPAQGAEPISWGSAANDYRHRSTQSAYFSV